MMSHRWLAASISPSIKWQIYPCIAKDHYFFGALFIHALHTLTRPNSDADADAYGVAVVAAISVEVDADAVTIAGAGAGAGVEKES